MMVATIEGWGGGDGVRVEEQEEQEEDFTRLPLFFIFKILNLG